MRGEKHVLRVVAGSIESPLSPRKAKASARWRHRQLTEHVRIDVRGDEQFADEDERRGPIFALVLTASSTDKFRERSENQLQLN
jgi:hypothetical protein